MSPRLRLVVLLAVVLAMVAGTVAYVMRVRGRQAEASAAPGPARADLASVLAQPHLVFRNTALGQGYGKVAAVPLAGPDGPRAITPASCDRVYAIAAEAVCLSANRGLTTTYKAQVLGSDWSPARDLPLTGLPNRARISHDGTLVATTTFVYGDSYTNPGQFSTRTVITRSTGEQVADLETFRFTVGDHTMSATDRNFWGVTFADDDAFYATGASGGKTWLVKGSVSGHTLTALREDVECPSLSPDGTRIAFKKHGDLPPGQWRLAVYDLRTAKETLLAEARSVDDQVEWLGNSTILYGLPRGGTATATSDVWSVPADGGGTPRVLVHDAWSPAVVR
jgi:dipeptidyl aminopeptidase/acylaminoacyl peptidase